jgi:hypothetical protein
MTSAKIQALADLKTIVNSLENNGNLYFMACNMTSGMATAIAQMSDKENVNVFFTTDVVDQGAPMDYVRICEGQNAEKWMEGTTRFYSSETDDKNQMFKSGMSRASKVGKPVRLGKNIQLNSQGEAAELPAKSPPQKAK